MVAMTRELPDCSGKYGMQPKRHWEVIHGPDYLIGSRFTDADVKHGGWTNGTITYRHIHSGRVVEKQDTIEELV
jgi:hypothetical protein